MAAGSFETSITIYQSTRRNTLEAPNQFNFENVKFRTRHGVFSCAAIVLKINTFYLKRRALFNVMLNLINAVKIQFLPPVYVPSTSSSS
jgi:hypothetical protein